MVGQGGVRSLPDGAMDLLVQRSSDYSYCNMPAAEAMAALRRQLSQGREHHYKAWLQDLHYARQRRD
jgi:hypothetical protein